MQVWRSKKKIDEKKMVEGTCYNNLINDDDEDEDEDDFYYILLIFIFIMVVIT